MDVETLLPDLPEPPKDDDDDENDENEDDPPNEWVGQYEINEQDNKVCAYRNPCPYLFQMLQNQRRQKKRQMDLVPFHDLLDLTNKWVSE